jgi:hypothetical protein
MDDTEIFTKIDLSICDFLREDSDLLTREASERSISHKLAEHLQKHFSNLKTDCEYNRHGNAVKKLRYLRVYDIKPDYLEAKTVFPDIVIHARGIDQCNLAVIEIKKSNSNHNWATDKEKLQSFTGDEFNYHLGIFLVADVENKKLIIEHVFQCGQEIPMKSATRIG